MKIKIEYPFTEKFREFGKVFVGKEERRNIILYYKYDKNKTSAVSMARYMMSVHLGRLLSKDEIVDHIDGDKTNDVIENFQIISVKENNIKALIQQNRTRLFKEFKCGVCGTIFSKEPRQLMNRKYTFCSRSCAGKFNSNIQYNKGLNYTDSIFIREYRKDPSEYDI